MLSPAAHLINELWHLTVNILNNLTSRFKLWIHCAMNFIDFAKLTYGLGVSPNKKRTNPIRTIWWYYNEIHLNVTHLNYYRRSSLTDISRVKTIRDVWAKYDGVMRFLILIFGKTLEFVYRDLYIWLLIKVIFWISCYYIRAFPRRP